MVGREGASHAKSGEFSTCSETVFANHFENRIFVRSLESQTRHVCVGVYSTVC